LNGEAPTRGKSDLIAELSSKIRQERPVTAEIVDSLVAAQNVRLTLKVPVARYVTDLATSLSLRDDKARTRAERVLATLLGTSAIQLAAKALDVLFEQERFLEDARILSDLRPIFAEEPDRRPLAAAVLHTLRLTYHEAGQLNSFFIAVDASGLRQLLSQIERALGKEKELYELLSAAGLPMVPSTGDLDGDG
jgi:hypothetical protein